MLSIKSIRFNLNVDLSTECFDVRERICRSEHQLNGGNYSQQKKKKKKN